jgi:GNAT superfamily N-acetyltransferase
MTRDLGRGYELDADRRRIDRAAVHAYLTTCYWALGRTRERQDELIDASGHVVGLYHDFARAVDCDAAGFVYMADVYVLEEHRGSGLGSDLVGELVEHGPFAGRRWILHTRDAAPLYERFGSRHHERLMQRDPA